MRKVLLVLALAVAALMTGPARAEIHIGPAVTISAPTTHVPGEPFDITGTVVAEAAGLPLVEGAAGLPFVTALLEVDGTIVADAETGTDGAYEFTWVFAPGDAPSHSLRVVAFDGLPAIETASNTITTHKKVYSELTLVPVTPTVSLGGNLGMRACALGDDGRTYDVTDRAAWATSDATIATVSSGLVSGIAQGTATITASFDGLTGSTPVSVSEGPGSSSIPCASL